MFSPKPPTVAPRTRSTIDFRSPITSRQAWEYSVPELREITSCKPLHNLSWTYDLVLSESVLERMPESTIILIHRGALECSCETIINLNNIERASLDWKRKAD